MTKVIQASELSLHDVIEKFHLQEVEDEQFFREWQDNLPEVTDAEKQWLDRVKANFLSLVKYPLHEEIVKMVVLSPLLSLADFFCHPFHPAAEVNVFAEDEGEIVRGKIDVLILQEQLWVAVIEAKNKQFSVGEALPQALFYMMNNPNPSKPTFGFVTNGSYFRFIKLTRQDTPKYALSDSFTLERRGNELYTVLSVLKRLGGVGDEIASLFILNGSIAIAPLFLSGNAVAEFAIALPRSQLLAHLLLYLNYWRLSR